MILRKLRVFRKNFRKIFRIFDRVGIFKGLKWHDAGSSGMKSWCQNVRNDLSYEMKLKVAIEGDRAKFDSCFSEKNVEMSATTWSKFFSWDFSSFSSRIHNYHKLFYISLGVSINAVPSALSTLFTLTNPYQPTEFVKNLQNNQVRTSTSLVS